MYYGYYTVRSVIVRQETKNEKKEKQYKVK